MVRMTFKLQGSVTNASHSNLRYFYDKIKVMEDLILYISWKWLINNPSTLLEDTSVIMDNFQ